MVNKVFLLGNLCRDVELRYIPSGTAVAETAIAVNSKISKDKEETLFVDLTIWGRSAEVAAEYLVKGSQIHVEGRLKLDTWDTQDGQKRSKIKVVVDRFQMLGGKRNGTSQTQAEPGNQVEPPPAEDDIPF